MKEERIWREEGTQEMAAGGTSVDGWCVGRRRLGAASDKALIPMEQTNNETKKIDRANRNIYFIKIPR